MLRTSALALALFSFAEGHTADLMVAVGGSGSIHPTVTSAINAALPNDRIIVAPGTYNESITITKSVEIVSNSQTQRYTINGTLNFYPATAGTTATVMGLALNGNVGDNAGGAASNSTLRLIDCRIQQLFSLSNAVRYVLMADSIFNGVSMERGDVIGCWFQGGPNGSVASITGVYSYPETSRFIGNSIVTDPANLNPPLQMHARNPFRIENNFIVLANTVSAVHVTDYSGTPTTQASHLLNNTIMRSGGNAWKLINVVETDPLQVDVRNNFTVAPLTPTSVSAGTGLIQAFNVHSANTTHVNNNTGAPIAGSPAINAGDPEVIYTDLDLTRNDAGCYGGSYSRDNFDDALPTTAFVVFVDSPRRTQAALAIPITASGIDR